MNLDPILRRVDPIDLSLPRSIVHQAIQPLSLAARANLEAKPDDSHSNLEWDVKLQRFRSRPIQGHYVDLYLAPLVLSVSGQKMDGQLVLEGLTCIDATSWLDRQLSGAGLSPASAIELPYTLPDAVMSIEQYSVTNAAAMGVLAGWYTLAQQVLTSVAQRNLRLDPGPGEVRCWPHHFDIATYVALETGDAETARGIGVGLSPGDGGYEEPYFYVNPWPHLPVEGLPAAASPGHWHVDGYVGSIATATELLGASAQVLPCAESFVTESFASGLAALGF